MVPIFSFTSELSRVLVKNTEVDKQTKTYRHRQQLTGYQREREKREKKRVKRSNVYIW